MQRCGCDVLLSPAPRWTRGPTGALVQVHERVPESAQRALADAERRRAARPAELWASAGGEPLRIHAGYGETCEVSDFTL